ncbi:VCBS domain-containing protein [Pseudovibrio sp. Ad37]|uniref:VCBS domain-containing protein n=1 Tax=Pseudovibrio sp. Ad37 TaxID=989422 RepID=UPI0007AEAA9F|nr:VCBS domain-containing protein [Pseudovibrio sp. Ad37]KZL22394.1 Leukotoxin [Pseudovibrio sp. Ad37]
MSDAFSNATTNQIPSFVEGDVISDFLKLTATSVSNSGKLGNSISISEPGLIAVGASADIVGSSYQAGSVTVFRPLEDGGFEELRVTAPDGAPVAHFGESVSIANDGTLIVGAPNASPNGIYSGGAIYVYQLDTDGNYGTPTKLTAVDASPADFLGSAVSINDDGQIIAAAKADDVNDVYDAGAVYVFTPEEDGSYSELKLTAPTSSVIGNFGSSVSNNKDGLVVVGAAGEGSAKGALYVYKPTADGYETPIKLEAAQLQDGDKFGASVAVNDKGEVIVSQPGNMVGGVVFAGSVVLYKPGADGSYTQKIEFTASDGTAGDGFGSSVAMNASGTLVVGAKNDDANGAIAGSVYVFVPQDDGTYKEFKIAVPDLKDGDEFGFAVSISDDGTITIGKPGNDIQTGYDTGAVYVIEPDPLGNYTRPANELVLFETRDTSDIAGKLSLNFSDSDISDSAHTASVKSVSLSGATIGLNRLSQQQLLDLVAVNSVESSDQSEFGKVNLDFTAGYEVFNYLSEGQTVELTYIVELDDGNGGKTEGTAKITIIGTNDTPTAEDVEVAVSEDARDYIIQTGLVDPDLSDRLSITAEADDVNGKLEVYGKNFKYSAAPHFNYLAAGETATETFTYTADDGHGGTVTRNVTIVVEGKNDAPVVSALTANILEHETADLELTYSDVDLTDTHTTSFDASATKGIVTFVDGVYHYNPNGQFDDLKERQTATDTFTVTVDDGHGGVVTRTATITITGRPDPISEISGSFLPNVAHLKRQGSVTDRFSSSHAVSEDGTLVYGAPSVRGGAVHVYSPNEDGSYELKVLPNPFGSSGSTFGYDIAINNHGQIVITGHQEDHLSRYNNKVLVYSLTQDGEYSVTELPITNDRAFFHQTIAIQDDGTIIWGNPFHNTQDLNAGEVVLFKPDGQGGYVEEVILPSAPAANENFGKFVEPGANGVIYVGGRRLLEDGAYQEGIFIMSPDSESGYTEKFVETVAVDDRSSLAVNDQGVVVISTPDQNVSGIGKGVVSVYTPNEDGSYSETTFTPNSRDNNSKFGAHIAISEEGVIAVNRLGDEKSEVYVYTPDGDGSYDLQIFETVRYVRSIEILETGVITVVGGGDERGYGLAPVQYHPDATGEYGKLKSEAQLDETTDLASIHSNYYFTFEDRYISYDMLEVSVKEISSSGVTEGLDTGEVADFLNFDGTEWSHTTRFRTAKFSFDSPANVFDYLKEGETVTLTYTVELDNGSGSPVTKDVKITIHGHDDVGTAEADNLNGGNSNDIMQGLAGHDVIDGGKGADRIDGGEGDDTLTGGTSSDTFQFKGSNFGNDVITDFDAGLGLRDVIEFDQAVFDDFNAVLAEASESGANTIITLDANTSVTLKNISIADLRQDDFQFV